MFHFHKKGTLQNFREIDQGLGVATAPGFLTLVSMSFFLMTMEHIPKTALNSET